MGILSKSDRNRSNHFIFHLFQKKLGFPSKFYIEIFNRYSNKTKTYIKFGNDQSDCARYATFHVNRLSMHR